jgi:hypothetical protein
MIVIFNGPPGSGKDEAAKYFKENFGFKSLSFKYQLFKETIKHFDVQEDWFMEGYDDREQKEKQFDVLNGYSRREAMIYVSEEILKPKHGKAYFGECVSEEIEDGVNYAIADGGFVEELRPLIERVGTDNIVIVQLCREGHDYSNDSRRYFDGNLIREFAINGASDIDNKYMLNESFDIQTYRIHNNGSLRNFRNVLTSIHDEINIDHAIEPA